MATIFYLLAALPRPWSGEQADRTYPALELGLKRGVGEQSPHGVLLRDTDASGLAIIALEPPPFRASDFRRVVWEVDGFGPETSASMLWRNDYSPGVTHTAVLQAESDGQLVAWVADDRNWIGRIRGLAMVIKGKPERPLRVVSVTVQFYGVVDALKQLTRDWLAFTPWNGASINSLAAKAAALPPALLACAAASLGCLVYGLLAWSLRWRLQFAAIAAIAGTAWLTVDGLWTYQLLQQTLATSERFAGKSLDEKHAVAEDAPVYAFAKRAREVLPATPTRVIVAAEDGALRGRLAYYLLPHQVYYLTYSGALPPPEALREGDYLVAMFRRNLQFNPSTGQLRWDSNPPVTVDLLLLEQGNAVFRMR